MLACSEKATQRLVTASQAMWQNDCVCSVKIDMSAYLLSQCLPASRSALAWSQHLEQAASIVDLCAFVRHSFHPLVLWMGFGTCMILCVR
jgi:hypothetical protein